MSRGTPDQGIASILETALQLFHKQGFHGTSVRQIADNTPCSLGLINHYFGSKEYLGAQCLRAVDQYCLSGLSQYVRFEEDPILYDLASVRILFYYIHHNGYKAFYLDALQQDFYFKYLSSRPLILIEALKKKFPIQAGHDEILLYSRYMPYMLEKTLVLKKEEGLFPHISYQRIPLMICTAAMSPFIPEAEVASRDNQAIQITQNLCCTLKMEVPTQFIQEFAKELVKEKRQM